MIDKNTRHKKSMEKQKEKVDGNIAKADKERGLVILLTGDGKGKSSSAFGMAMRSLGYGYKVGIVQFIKGVQLSGEEMFIRDKHPEVYFHQMGTGFTWDTQDRNRDTEAAQAAFAKACEMMSGGEFDLVVLDEINIAMRYEYLSVDQVLEGLEGRASRTSVILTGRDAKPALCDYADLVTEMTEVKHPFQAGIKAQKGLDF